MKIQKTSKTWFRFLTLLAALLLVGSRLYPPELELKRSTRTSRARKTLLEVPVSFGKTHFIVGLSQEEVASRAKQTTQSLDDERATVNEAYFAPDDDLQQVLIQLIDQEQKGIYLAIFSFTDKEIAEALLRARERGVQIELVADPSFLQDRYTKIAKLYKRGISVFIYDPKSSRKNNATMSNIMHNKFVLFLNNSNRSLVWTGSFNFTKSARLSNQENVVVLNNKRIVQRYIDRFHALKKRCNTCTNSHISIGRAST